MGVWDIEVEGDHSYVTHGFLNHNCHDPNLQNIPRPDSKYGKIIRGVWTAEPGWKLVVGDYGQIELVMFAHFAGKGTLFEGFWNGIDPHQVTADAVGIERQAGKILNFTMVFGAGLYTIASQLGVTANEAKKILAQHQRAMPEIYQLKRDIVSECRRRKPIPYVTTLLGGKRRLFDINSADSGRRSYAERQAVSAVIQGSAADLNKLSMVRADTLLAAVPDAFLTLTVHDELVIETPEEYSDKVESILREAMTGEAIQNLIEVPLSVDIKTVSRWSEAK